MAAEGKGGADQAREAESTAESDAGSDEAEGATSNRPTAVPESVAVRELARQSMASEPPAAAAAEAKSTEANTAVTPTASTVEKPADEPEPATSKDDDSADEEAAAKEAEAAAAAKEAKAKKPAKAAKAAAAPAKKDIGLDPAKPLAVSLWGILLMAFGGFTDRHWTFDAGLGIGVLGGVAFVAVTLLTRFLQWRAERAAEAAAKAAPVKKARAKAPAS